MAAAPLRQAGGLGHSRGLALPGCPRAPCTPATAVATTPSPLLAPRADAFRSIVRQEGWLGLYRGVGPALLLTSHGAVQFAVFEELKRFDVPDGLRTHWHLLIGAGSKVVASTLTYPYQVIKSRIQARGSTYTGVLDCASDALR